MAFQEDMVEVLDSDRILAKLREMNFADEEEESTALLFQEVCDLCNKTRRCITDLEVKHRLVLHEIGGARAQAAGLELETAGLLKQLGELQEELAAARGAEQAALQAVARYSEEAQLARAKLEELEKELGPARAAAEMARIADAEHTGDVLMAQSMGRIQAEIALRGKESLKLELEHLRERLSAAEAQAQQDRQALQDQIISARSASQAALLRQPPPKPFAEKAVSHGATTSAAAPGAPAQTSATSLTSIAARSFEDLQGL